MKTLAAAGFCAIALGIFGCAETASSPSEANGVSEDELRKLGANGALSCDADSGGAHLALVAAGAGKFAVVTLKPAAGDLFALSASTGTMTSTSSSWSWKSGGATFDVGSNMKGTFKKGSQSTKVTCTAASATEAGAWRAANALAAYADEIDGLADTVLEEMQETKRPKAYTVFAVATSKRGSLALGTTERGTAGALPGSDEAQSQIDENDSSYGGMSAAYALGGGDDYGEWFQGASDGISLAGDVVPALTNGARAGFIAHSKAKALSSVVDSAQPSAVEITVGPWTFFVPDAFPK